MLEREILIMKKTERKMKSIRSGFGGRGDLLMSRMVFFISMLGILLMVFIIGFLLFNGLPVIKEVSLSDIIFGREWYPVEDPPVLGMFPLIAGTIAATLLSCAISLPIALALAVFTAEIAPRRARKVFKVMLELLGFLPSIVLGFLGMMVIAPRMQNMLNIPTGLNLLTASILLGFIVIPVVASLAEEALSAVPRELRDASYALGATRWETVRKVVIPHAASGIASASLLGVMRALGETMVVLMAAGGAAIIPLALTDPVRPLTATIAAEMGETPVGSIHYHALFFSGLILLVITMLINLASFFIEKRGRKI